MGQGKTNCWGSEPANRLHLSNQIAKNLELLATNTASKQGFQVVGFQIFDHMKPMTIQIQVRHQNGADVSLDDCSELSVSIGDSMENANLVNSRYILEISSPGLNDILETDKEFETFKGFPIEVSTKNQKDEPVLKSGLLQTKSKEHLLINVKGRMSKIPIENVIQVRLTSPT